VQKAVSMGRALRAQYNIKVRQPLSVVEIVTREEAVMASLLEMEDIIREELNVKQVIFRDNEDDLVDYEAKANFRVLGKELGKDMKAATEKIAALSRAEIQALLDGATLSLDVPTVIAGEDGKSAPSLRQVEITAAKVEIRRIEKSGLKVLSEGGLTVALDTEITEALSREGDVRDLVRGVQNLRKEGGLAVTDRITLTVSGPPRLKAAFDTPEAASYLAAETLASSLLWASVPGQSRVEAGEEAWLVKVEKAV